MGRHHLVLSLISAFSVLIPSQVFAQKRVSADVEVKSLFDGKVITTKKSVYCTNNGRLVVYNVSPVEFVQVTNSNGESKTYFPDRSEVIADNSGDNSSRNEPLSLMLFGHLADLGVTLKGYAQTMTETDEEGHIIKTYTTSRDDLPAKVKVVLKDYLPIYSENVSAEGEVLSRTYFSNYRNVGRMMFPCRHTGIVYSQGDSVVVRTLYSNILTDRTDDPKFDFEIPSSARTVNAEDVIRNAFAK